MAIASSEGYIQIWIRKTQPYERETDRMEIVWKKNKWPAHVVTYHASEIPEWAERLYGIVLMVGRESDACKKQIHESIDGKTWFTLKVNKGFFKSHGITL